MPWCSLKSKVLPGGSSFELSLALCRPQAHIQELAGTGRDAGAHKDHTVAPKPTDKIATPGDARGSRRSCFKPAAGDGDGDGVRKEPPIQILGTLESKAPTSPSSRREKQARPVFTSPDQEILSSPRDPL
jgi:hypothetical protein